MPTRSERKKAVLPEQSNSFSRDNNHPASSARQHPLTQLQMQVGNQATLQLLKNRNISLAAASKNGQSKPSSVVQLMPTRKQVETEIGEPIEGESTRYRPVLDSVDRLNDYLDSTLADEPSGMDTQLDEVLTRYKDLEQVTTTYISAKKKGNKVTYMKKVLLPTINRERVTIVQTVSRYKRQPPNRMPKLWIIANAPVRSINLNKSMFTGERGKGGINSVKFFRSAYQEDGVFKETKKVIKNDTDLPKNSTKEEKESARTETMTANFAGFDKNDARLAERNVAMSRLDQLLGAGVIARTEFALRKTGSNMKKGVFMAKAKGKSAGSIGNSGGLVRHESDKEGKNPNTIHGDDPNLQRCLSRLQLIDVLAMQVDRHTGNYFIENDENGNVLSVTGIDNDMAFGNNTDIHESFARFPAVSRYVDKELAKRILALKDNQLTAVMEDLLSPSEIDALLNRLHSLQTHLQNEQTKLLDPDEWNEATAKGMLDESKASPSRSQKSKDPNLKMTGSYHRELLRWL